MSARSRHTPWFRSAAEEAESRAFRTRRRPGDCIDDLLFEMMMPLQKSDLHIEGAIDMTMRALRAQKP